MLKWALFFLLIPYGADASHDIYVIQKSQESLSLFTRARKEDIPGYITDSPQETRFNDYGFLEGTVSKVYEENEAAQFLKESTETRPYFLFDALHDPIAKNSKEALEDPIKFYNKEEYENLEPFDYEEKFCEESKQGLRFKCLKTLVDPEIKHVPAHYEIISHYEPLRSTETILYIQRKYNAFREISKGSDYYSLMNSTGDLITHYWKRNELTIRKSIPESFKAGEEIWSGTCGPLEAKEREGICRLINKVCPKGPETREVMSSVSGVAKSYKVSKECWQYKMEYECRHPSLNNCSFLREQGCEQIGSSCLKHIGNECVVFIQKLQCPKESTVKKSILKAGEGKFKLSDLPQGAPISPNTELNEVVAKLSILQEVQKELRTTDGSALPHIFKGNLSRCTTAFASFSECCGKSDGWGHTLNLTGCNGEEQELAQKRGKGLCVEVGEYCAEKVLSVCIRKKKSFCCFPSKLARIVHEQGRPQLGISWGDGENPECRGFGISEFSRINFHRLNLSEIFSEIASRIKPKAVDVVKRNLTHSVEQMSASLNPQAEREEF